MIFIILFFGLVLGVGLNLIINMMSYKICLDSDEKLQESITFNDSLESLRCSYKKKFNPLIILISVILVYICFFRLGLSFLFMKGVALCSVLIVLSFIDFYHKIIPNKLPVITLVFGVLFLPILNTSLADFLGGMIIGGGILFLLAIVPNALGGGDVKIMFALGGFLGIESTLWALLLAFSLSSIVSICLLVFKIKGFKDYIPFGPFLALGSLISFFIFI